METSRSLGVRQPMSDRRRFKTPEEAFQHRTQRSGECLIWTGATDKNGYGTIRVAGRLVQAHRYAWEQENGPLADGIVIDHREHCNPACVEISHLREATIAQNIANRAGADRDNASTGVRNVYPNHGGFMVRIGKKYLGTYSTLEEATHAAEIGRRELFGEFAGRG